MCISISGTLDYAVDEVTVDTTTGGNRGVFKTYLKAFEIPPVKPNVHSHARAGPAGPGTGDRQANRSSHLPDA